MKDPETESVKVRINIKDRKELQRIALAEYRTFAEQVRLVIREWLKSHLK